ncbi:hypothetical protein [Stenomitos frigidus]|uniref:Addiction module component n=1 Tax=Stenomitos frigidus ULC18 TaxID=2107698 RepID=A0A2T1EJ05_9CYAN|nr:hypothetical protein [Stenomitos frigidus]PSB32671.1 hypothetical protein C7B82_05330 [Stenomitos frigidus ULC18]
MLTYEEVLNLAQRLTPTDQVRLLEALKALAYQSVIVEGTDELIPSEEIEESENALQNYRTGRDNGLSSEALKLKLFGRSVG